MQGSYVSFCSWIDLGYELASKQETEVYLNPLQAECLG